MSSFEEFAKRARLDLGAYFTANNIFSDKELVEYCERNSIGLPTQAYFKEEIQEKKTPEKEIVVPKPKPKSKTKPKPQEGEKKSSPPKKTRTSRTRKPPVKK